MIEELKKLDTELFIALNSHYNGFWDVTMDWISSKYTWIPLYVLLLLPLIRKYKRRIWLVLLSIALMITVSDQVSVFIKNSTKRYRPCHHLELKDKIHVVSGCGGQYGFISSHAANTFALAAFLSFLFYKRSRVFMLIMFLWATVVSYSRIYVGVHYPADILGGAMMGIAAGVAAVMVYFRIEKKLFLKT